MPVCSSCESLPELLRIKRYLPSLNEGRGKEVTIRYTKANKRLTDIIDAISTMKRIDEELKTGEFEPIEYASKADRDFFKFERQSNDYVSLQEQRVKRGELAPYSFEGKERYHRLYLVPFFRDAFVDEISRIDVLNFYNSFTDKLRTRDLATQELKCFLRFLNDVELIKNVPRFPKTSSSGKHDGENFIDLDTQALIINSIGNPLYRAAIKTLAIYMLRPCEVRALRVMDLNFDKNTLTISHHFSKNKLIKGRKSDSKKNEVHLHRLPITNSFIEILDEIGFSDKWSPTQYLFSNSDSSPLGMKTLTTHWKNTANKIGFSGVTLYQGTRHAGLSNLVRNGVNESIAMRISGHTTLGTFKRYAQVSSREVSDYLK